MIHNCAQCVLTANVGARVSTFLFDASLISLTIRVHNALGSTTDVRVAMIIRQANTSVVYAHAVRSAVQARIVRFCYWSYEKQEQTSLE